MIFVVRFVRKDGKPDEEYYYQALDPAVSHFKLFDNDDSGLYKKTLLLVNDGTVRHTIDRHEF